MTMEADFDIPVQFQRLRREAVLAIRTNPNDTDKAGLAAFFGQAATAAGGSAGGGVQYDNFETVVDSTNKAAGQILFSVRAGYPADDWEIDRVIIVISDAEGNQAEVNSEVLYIGEEPVGTLSISTATLTIGWTVLLHVLYAPK